MTSGGYYDMICGMRIEDIVRLIMAQKAYLGEFSMDMYCDNIASEDRMFVAKVMLFHSDIDDTHFRAASFVDALAGVVECFDRLGTGIVTDIKVFKAGQENEMLPINFV